MAGWIALSEVVSKLENSNNTIGELRAQEEFLSNTACVSRSPEFSNVNTRRGAQNASVDSIESVPAMTKKASSRWKGRRGSPLNATCVVLSRPDRTICCAPTYTYITTTPLYVSRLHYSTKEEEIVEYLRIKTKFSLRVARLESRHNMNFNSFVRACALHLLALQPASLSHLSARRQTGTTARCNRIAALRLPVLDPFRGDMPAPAGELVMTNKRKRVADVERRAKRQRRRHRSHSQPASDTDNAEKRQALKRLFGRICSVEIDNQRNDPPEEEEEEEPIFGDENEDPLLDSVPVDMDPEQLGFLVCAQETLRFLHGRGIPPQHPVFARLRSRLLRGIDEMAAA
ncbi:unnamed protein product [Chilo suppressalis]|uniref:BESS domain-containing protein n=1 Tax=Chilo suppressalis TaxID=168631 RepID=A0ABN8B2J1_CHISP|nr:unnamed protein product [Chilo suppressalis]